MKALFALLLFPCITSGQELFTFTEPASNMSAKSIGLRLNNRIMLAENETVYQLNPEVMWGVSRLLMIHGDLYMSNGFRSHMQQKKAFGYDGAGLYIKYRVHSDDGIHNHFRIAAFTRLSSSNREFTQQFIDLNGQNSGVETGFIATKLTGKVALSAGGSFMSAFDNGSDKFPYSGRNAAGFTLSAGKLLLPKEYTDYKQVNMNAMLELLGQYNFKAKEVYMDLAPSIQFIFLSKVRVDLGYRFAITDNLKRTDKQSVLLRLEYNLFNVFK